MAFRSGGPKVKPTGQYRKAMAAPNIIAEKYTISFLNVRVKINVKKLYATAGPYPKAELKRNENTMLARMNMPVELILPRNDIETCPRDNENL